LGARVVDLSIGVGREEPRAISFCFGKERGRRQESVASKARV